MNSLNEILAELTALGWTISWAFQFEPNHWRVSLCKQSDIGEPQGTYINHCADAPTLAEAIEDALCRRNDAEFEQTVETGFTIEPTTSPLANLRLAPAKPPIVRRI